MNQTDKNKKPSKEDIHSTKSDKRGVAGLLETFLRRFRLASFMLALTILYLLCMIAMGVSATPGIFLFKWLDKVTGHWPLILHYGSLGVSIAGGYFLYGLTLIFVIPFFNFIIPLRVKPFRGSYYSLASVPWYIHNAFTYVVRYTFLEFFTPTPLNILFYKMMGMKIGKGVHINTTNISDPCLIELGDHVTLAGSATLFAHYATQGYLVVEPVKVGKRVTIGLKATVMGNVEIGDNAVIAPHAVVKPKSRIPADSRYGESK